MVIVGDYPIGYGDYLINVLVSSGYLPPRAACPQNAVRLVRCRGRHLLVRRGRGGGGSCFFERGEPGASSDVVSDDDALRY